MDEYRPVILYTDGACCGNPGPGGYGVILIAGPHRQELCGGFRLTTNNRMEIMAAIAGLQLLNTPCSVTLYSDSRYLVDAMSQGWVRRWRENGWMRNRKESVENADLWEQLLVLCDRHTVNFVWLPGHAGNPENERCDQLSRQAAQGTDLPVDAAYEQGMTRKVLTLF